MASATHSNGGRSLTMPMCSALRPTCLPSPTGLSVLQEEWDEIKMQARAIMERIRWRVTGSSIHEDDRYIAWNFRYAC